MATHTGFIVKLKDKSTRLEDKIKLAMFAWISEDVWLPNKHQTILDFICGLLINKKKHNITLKDEYLIWRILDKFVHSSPGLLKPSFLQAVVEGLSSCCHETLDIDHINYILRCASQLMSTRSVTVSHFDALLSLVSVSCQLLLKEEFSSVHSILDELIDHSTEVLAKCFRSHLNKVHALQNLTDKLLKSSLELLCVKNVPCLTQFLIDFLLFEDYHEYYVTHLSLTSAAQKKSVPKSVLNVFTMLFDHGLPMKIPSSFSFLPKFLKAFSHHKLTTPRHCYLMLKHFITLITSSRDHDLWLSKLVECLQACQDVDIFKANTDSNDILKWFFQLTELVLEQPKFSSWFQYFRSLLLINHLLVEKYWSVLFSSCFSSQLSEDCYKDLDMLMTEMIQVYLKMRRTCDLVSSLLSCMSNWSSSVISIKSLHNFYSSLCQMFKEMPQSTVLEIWDKLKTSLEAVIQQSESAHLVKHQIPITSNSVSSFVMEDNQPLHFVLNQAPGTEWIVVFNTCLLEHAILIEPRSGDVFYKSVCQMVQEMESSVLKPLTKRKSERSTMHHTIEEFLQAWAKLKVLLFPRWRLGELDEQESQEMKRILKKITPMLEPSFCVDLASQMLTSDVSLTLDQCDVESVVTNLLDMSRLTKEMVFEYWDMKAEEISPSLQAVAQFYRFAQLFRLIYAICPDKLLDKCGQLIVQILCVAETDHVQIQPGKTNLFQQVLQFLGQPCASDAGKLQTKILLHAWRQIFFSCLSTSKKSPKKRKLSCDRSMLVKYLIGDIEEVQASQVTCDNLRQAIQNKPYFQLLLSTLDQLDFHSSDYPRYQLGLLCMLGSLQLAASSDAVDVRVLVKQNLIKALCKSFNLSALFSCIEPSELLNFVATECGKSAKNVEDDKLMQTVIHGVVNNHQAVLTLPNYTKEIVQELIHDTTDSSKVKILTYLVRHCSVYLTKSFHIPAVKDSALDVYVVISKFFIKHGLAMFKATHQDHKVSNGDSVEVILGGLSEVLNIWSAQMADSESNRHLEVMVNNIMDRLLQDTQQLKELELRFLESCCVCQRQCQQVVSEDPSQEHPDRHVNFFTEHSLEEITDIFLKKCIGHVSSLFQHTREELVSWTCTEVTSCWSLENLQQWPKLLVAEIDLLVGAAACMDEETFGHLLKMLLTMLVHDDSSSFYVATSLWRQLVSSPFVQPQLIKMFFHCIYEFLYVMIGCVASPKSKHTEMPLLQRFVLEGLSDLVDLGKTQVSSRMILLCLDAAVAFTLSSPEDIRALYRLTNTLLVQYTNTVLQSAAGLVSVAQKLVSACIKMGNLQDMSDESKLKNVVSCAQLISRLLTFLTSADCKVELSKVAYLIVAEYILKVHEEQLHPLVKAELVKGIYTVMAICDKHRFLALTAALPPGIKETFKILHQDFNKYHRYSGRV